MNTPTKTLRGPGRPRKEYEALEKALARMGGVRRVVTDLYVAGYGTAAVAEKIYLLTGIRVSSTAIYRWLRRWDDEVSHEEAVA